MDAISPVPPESKAESFGYVCHHCGKCCQHMQVHLNPYEVARLASNRGLTTGEFRASYTESGAGLKLKQTETGSCIFLGPKGCTVYLDRPLACRLYPLGLHISSDGRQSFVHVAPHPQSEGEYTRTGSIADFLKVQNADVFMQAADEYFRWFCAAQEYLCQAADGETTIDTENDQSFARDLLDMDASIAAECAASQVAEPTDIQGRKDLHLKLLYRLLEPTTETRHEK
jgi:uncharacterized protein